MVGTAAIYVFWMFRAHITYISILSKFYGFTQSLQVNGRLAPRIGPTMFRLVFLFHYYFLTFSAMQFELLINSLNEHR